MSIQALIRLHEKIIAEPSENPLKQNRDPLLEILNDFGFEYINFETEVPNKTIQAQYLKEMFPGLYYEVASNVYSIALTCKAFFSITQKERTRLIHSGSR